MVIDEPTAAAIRFDINNGDDVSEERKKQLAEYDAAIADPNNPLTEPEPIVMEVPEDAKPAGE